MNVKYYEDTKIDKNRKSIFLAGPTPRDKETKSWRPEAIRILEQLGYDGDVYVPEFNTGIFGDLEYTEIIDWELDHLANANAICFWIPREMEKMPAFTTNVEFGYHLKTGKAVYGRPDSAPKNRYLDYLYEKEYGKQPLRTLEDTLKECVGKLKDKQPQVFFTADTHFSQERTFQLSKRQFKNVQEMDSEMIKAWNQTISKDDVVYHLGDFGVLENISKLNGNIILILGNYEKAELEKKFNNNFEKYKKHLISLGFKDVIKDNLTLNIPEFGEKVFLTHDPLDCKKGMFNLFGHVHKLCMIKQFGLNVGTDNFYFKPASIQDVVFYKTAIQKYYDNSVFCGKEDLQTANNLEL